ncbi:glycosyltransferase family 2 protein [Crenobacter intestini]|uniref:Glycosyltransferase n=1 Tax=Crenobacter intestini TaxID=2563443 RepID=A0A4T0UWI2_9NEIS|nr:glycosyltransferase family 2 protein [Crenobacter intestini]TIC83440.1 glycosyltransferase [Crenobacter intestini]
MKVSVIVSTYNRPDALQAVLEGFCHQQVGTREWEVIIADDGSDEATARVVEAFRERMAGRFKHVWHADQGFRLAEIRNRAAMQASGDYLVFLDGDCIPLPDFIAQQAILAEAGWVVAGNRILLGQAFTESYLSGRDKPVFAWTWLDWGIRRLHGSINNALGWLRLPLPKWRQKRAQDWRLLRGCNIGVWKQDFLAVDGFDATFSGWGYEDSDFAVRLLRHGARLKNGRFAVPVMHLWHRENDRSQSGENWARFEASLHGSHVRAVSGLSGLLAEHEHEGRTE